jgi:tripartite-type tricarboxylate transporter receptor subunit TctC
VFFVNLTVSDANTFIDTSLSFSKRLLMSINRRGLAGYLLSFLAILSNPVFAEDANQGKPLKIVIPFGPGGGSDSVMRVLQPHLAEYLKRPVIVENKPGAGGTIGAGFVAKSSPDGNTLLLSETSVVSISPTLYGNLTYQVSDLVPVINLAQYPLVLVAATSFRANSMSEVLALDKSAPGKLSIASSGNGTSPHLTIELLNQKAGAKFVHVPYKGSGPAINDALGGQVDMAFTGFTTVAGLVRTGKLKVLAVTSAHRVANLPQVMSISESGVTGFESLLAQGVFAPKGTAVDQIRALNQAFNAVLNNSDVKDQLSQQGLSPRQNTYEEFGEWIKSQSVQWEKVIRLGGIHPE